MKKQVCVIGMGRFGSTVAHELYQSGHDVLAIDMTRPRSRSSWAGSRMLSGPTPPTRRYSRNWTFLTMTW